MKILKPGKVEMRKFVCEKCGCEFLAGEYESAMYFEKGNRKVFCPTCGKSYIWDKGEPYEEPAPTQSDRERLDRLLIPWTGSNSLRGYFVEHLINSGVTFREDAT